MSAAATSEGLKIEIDRELCYGFGDCVDSVPGVFELDEENTARVIDANAADRDDLMMAAQDCPVDAIILTDPETGQQVYP